MYSGVCRRRGTRDGVYPRVCIAQYASVLHIAQYASVLSVVGVPYRTARCWCPVPHWRAWGGTPLYCPYMGGGTSVLPLLGPTVLPAVGSSILPVVGFFRTGRGWLSGTLMTLRFSAR